MFELSPWRRRVGQISNLCLACCNLWITPTSQLCDPFHVASSKLGVVERAESIIFSERFHPFSEAQAFARARAKSL